MTVEKTVHRGSVVWLIDRTHDGKFNLLELAADYDFTRGLPAGGGECFDTLEEATGALKRRVKDLEEQTSAT